VGKVGSGLEKKTKTQPYEIQRKSCKGGSKWGDLKVETDGKRGGVVHFYSFTAFVINTLDGSEGR